MTSKHPWIGLVLFMVVCFAAAGIGGAVTDAEDRYLVCDPDETELESAQLGFRPGLVVLEFLYGRGSLAGLAGLIARSFVAIRVMAIRRGKHRIQISSKSGDDDESDCR